MKNFSQKLFSGSVVKVDVVAQGIKKITIKISAPFDFLAWQYVWVEIPELKFPDPRGSRRAFSIINTINSDNTIEIVARISESGYKQSLFALATGDSLIIHGPFGNSFVVSTEHQPKYIVMIAGGVGIAAFLPMIETIKIKGYDIKCYLIYLNNKPESTPFLQELQLLKKGGDFFDFHVKYEYFSWSDVKDITMGLTTGIEWWVAGSQSMVDHVYHELEQGGISRQDMVFENFYPTSKDSLTVDNVYTQLKEDNLFAKAIQNSTNHTVITDPEGTVLFANKAAENITGYSQEEIIGNTPRLWGGMMSRDFYLEFWRKKISGEPFQGEIINRRKNGELYYSIAHIAPIFGLGREIIGFIGTEEDISDIRKTENALVTTTRRFELAVKSGHIGVWEWDVVNNILTWDDQMYVLYGIKKEDFTGAYDAWQKGLHPDDKKPGDEAIQLALQGKKDFDISFRVIWPNGQIRYLKAYAIVERDNAGKPLKMIGVNFDITKEKEIDQAKTEFVSLASHQLRTPLSTIGWYSEMLLAEDVGKLNAEQKSYLEEVYKGNQRMVGLVNALLNVSRIDLGTFAVEPKPTDLREVATIHIKELTPQIEAKKIIFKQDFVADLPIINVDPKLMGIIFQNLLSNAVKYTPEGGTVTCSLTVKNKDILIAVGDTGYGIPTAQQDKIFTKLFRADNVRRKETEGTGLGLYIVKAIVDQSAGKTWFESVEDKGTTFYVSLPLKGMKSKQGNKELT